MTPGARLRWYTVEASHGGSPRELASLLRRELFSPRGRAGFVLDESKVDRVVGRYVERVNVVDSVVDPFGREHSSKRVIFRQVNFRYEPETPHLELLNASRGVAPFIARLMELYDFAVTIVPLKFALRPMLVALERVVGRLTVRSLDVGSVLVAEDVFARVTFRGGRDVRRDASEFLSNRELPIVRASVSWKINGDPVECVFTTTSARLEDALVPIVRPTLRAVIRSVIEAEAPKI